MKKFSDEECEVMRSLLLRILPYLAVREDSEGYYEDDGGILVRLRPEEFTTAVGILEKIA